MRMLKIAAVASLLLAPVAMGNVSLLVDKTSVNVEPGQTFTLTFTLNSDAGEQVNAVSIFPFVSANGILSWTTPRTFVSASLTDPLTPATAGGKALGINGLPDLGLVVADPTDTTTFSTGTDTLETITIKALPAAQINSKYTLTWGGAWGSFNMGSNDSAFADTPAVTVNITPEPISALLLAVGAAFFARRRVA